MGGYAGLDMQQNPEISGMEYQQGTPYGYELREYLLEKWHRRYGYCGAQNTHLEVNTLFPKALVVAIESATWRCPVDPAM